MVREYFCANEARAIVIIKEQIINLFILYYFWVINLFIML